MPTERSAGFLEQFEKQFDCSFECSSLSGRCLAPIATTTIHYRIGTTIPIR